ncbi:MAG: hypothetical protein C4560_13455 [Nitrospiraceae bacterium]|nr:MAG: hypothetical protein C4560_13455 [Nitrospiraceae bacterium]
MGSYPTVVDWDGNGKNSLLAGSGLGGVYVFKNIGTNPDGTPILGDRTEVLNAAQTGPRATPVMIDWNGDGYQDILAGNLAGNIKIFTNDGSSNFSFSSNLQVNGADYDIGSRSAPRIYDWNSDGLNDILVGEYSGYVHYLQNAGTNSAPSFNTSERLLLMDGTALRYYDPLNPNAAPRSRLDIADWNNDGNPDMLVGGADGRVMLFTAAPEPVASTLFLVGSGVFGLWGLRKKIRAGHNE